MSVHIIDHPLVLHKLSIMRNIDTPTSKFRQCLREISMLMGYEITRDFPLSYERIATPLQEMEAPKIAGKKVVIKAPNNSEKNLYVKNIVFNGRNYTKNYFDYKALLNGATINYTMDSKPNKARGVNASDDPYSFSTAGK